VKDKYMCYSLRKSDDGTDSLRSYVKYTPKTSTITKTKEFFGEHSTVKITLRFSVPSFYTDGEKFCEYREICDVNEKNVQHVTSLVSSDKVCIHMLGDYNHGLDCHVCYNTLKELYEADARYFSVNYELAHHVNKTIFTKPWVDILTSNKSCCVTDGVIHVTQNGGENCYGDDDISPSDSQCYYFEGMTRATFVMIIRQAVRQVYNLSLYMIDVLLVFIFRTISLTLKFLRPYLKRCIYHSFIIESLITYIVVLYKSKLNVLALVISVLFFVFNTY